MHVAPVDLLMSSDRLATLEREHQEVHPAANVTLKSVAGLGATWIDRAINPDGLGVLLHDIGGPGTNLIAALRRGDGS